MTRLLRALLWLYPPSYRCEYGEEMVAAARYRWSRASGGARGGVVRALLARVATMLDVLIGAPAVWIDRLGRVKMGGRGGWFLDLRFVLRSLWRSRGYALTTAIVLACSVAAVATVFSFVRGTLLNAPPWPEPDRIMVVWGSNVEDGQLRDVVSGPAYMALRERTTTFEYLAAFHSDGAYLLVDGRPEVLDVVEAGVDFFRVLGVEPALGRLFGEEDRTYSGPNTVVVTHAFWQDRLGGRPDVIGTRLPFEEEPRTVVGVLPEGFEFVAPAPLFTPLHDDVLAAAEPSHIHFNVLARLAPGAARADAAADVARAAEHFTDLYPPFEGWTFRSEPLHDVTVEAVRPAIWTLAATVSLVLIVALVNLTTLFRIRSLARHDELAVRMALGAGWIRVARILSLETVLLAVVGGLLGLAATPFLLARVAEMVPEWIAIPDSASRVPVLRAVLDPSVALVALSSAVFGALALTLPTLVSTLRRLGPVRSSRVHGGIRGTRLLVGLEIAAATAMCVGAGLLVRSADKLLEVDLGLEHEGLVTTLFADVWGMDPAERTTYFRQTVEAVEAIPGVQRAGIIDYIDFQAEDDFARVYFLDRSMQPTRDVREEWRRVDEGLFEAAGMRIVAGRGFEADDFMGTPRAVVVNEAFATKHWPGSDALGAFLSTHNQAYRDMEVVGVVADVRSLGPGAPAPPMMYAPNQGDGRGTVGMYVRVSGDPANYGTALRDAIWSVDSTQPIAGVWPMSAFVETWVAIPRAARSLVLALAVLTLLLSVVGVFGVVSYAVRTRRSEFGVRMALGASPDRLEREQIKTMLAVIVVALGIGLVGGVLAARGARGMLYGVSPLDPVAVVGALATMATAALVASYLPARRVGRIDPTEAMRAE